MRAFIAIEIPEYIKDNIVEIQDKLKKAFADITWVKKENMHITLRFFGEIQEKSVEDIKKFIRDTAKKNPKFNITLNNVGAFPSWNYPRVLWIGIKDPDKIIKLATELEDDIVKGGFAPLQDKPFQAHLTIGRIKGPVNKESLKNISLSISFSSTMEVNKIIFFQSRLTPHGHIHTNIFQENLQSPPLQKGD
jgi:2'-5' RNA ligase